jgi:hypothetical protein
VGSCFSKTHAKPLVVFLPVVSRLTGTAALLPFLLQAPPTAVSTSKEQK